MIAIFIVIAYNVGDFNVTIYNVVHFVAIVYNIGPFYSGYLKYRPLLSLLFRVVNFSGPTVARLSAVCPRRRSTDTQTLTNLQREKYLNVDSRCSTKQ